MNTFDFIFKVFVPVGLMTIMFGMGLDLRSRDFKHLLSDPQALGVGILGQMVMLPAIAFALVALMPMPPEIALGLIILAACPGGVTSNAVVFAAGGDKALSVSLTAFNSMASVFTIPFIVGLGLQMFPGEEGVLRLDPLETITKLAIICIIPIGTGMVCGYFFPRLRRYSAVFFKRFSTFMLAFLLVVVLIAQHDFLLSNLHHTWIPVLSLTFLCLGTAWAICRLLTLSLQKSTTLIIEIGLQNSNLALLVATTILNDAALAVSPAIYGILSFMVVMLFAAHRGRLLRAQAA